MSDSGGQEVTGLLTAWSGGDEAALERLVPLVYAELKRQARRHMYAEGAGNLLQPTALVHEVYLKLVAQKDARWQNRVHFFSVSSQLMRRILVDTARSRLRQKRGADVQRISLDDAPGISTSRAADVVALDDALTDLAKLDERRSRVVEMRYFGGMSVEETAAALNLSEDTVMRDWKAARRWLYAHLNSGTG